MDLTTENMRQLMPYAAHLDMQLIAASPEEVVATMDWAPETTTTGGAMHGGALMSLADTIGGTVAFLNLPEGAATSTISSSSVFLRAVREGTVTATGRLVHRGRSTIVAETRVEDAQGRDVLRTTQTQAVLMPRDG
ncbi:MAG: PaaI family thioesterase [Marmoricola sp.]